VKKQASTEAGCWTEVHFGAFTSIPLRTVLVGLAMRAERKVIDKIVDGLKFHG